MEKITQNPSVFQFFSGFSPSIVDSKGISFHSFSFQQIQHLFELFTHQFSVSILDYILPDFAFNQSKQKTEDSNEKNIEKQNENGNKEENLNVNPAENLMEKENGNIENKIHNTDNQEKKTNEIKIANNERKNNNNKLSYENQNDVHNNDLKNENEKEKEIKNGKIRNKDEKEIKNGNNESKNEENTTLKSLKQDKRDEDEHEFWDFEKGVWKDHHVIHKQLNLSQPLFLFAYGSLCWNVAPELNGCKVYKVFVNGYRRKFWQMSSDHRGTMESPGLVCSLISDSDYNHLTGIKTPTEAICYGLAFEIPAGLVRSVIQALDYREKGGYKRKTVKMFLCEEEKSVEGIAYIGEINNPHFAKKELRENIFRCAEVIAVAEGPSGKNRDYLMNLNKFLRSNNFRDDYIYKLGALVEKKQENKGNEEDLLVLEGQYSFDFSFCWPESENLEKKISFWLWKLYCVNEKKDLLHDFYEWIPQGTEEIKMKNSEEQQKKGIIVQFSQKDYNCPKSLVLLIQRFLLLHFENSFG